MRALLNKLFIIGVFSCISTHVTADELAARNYAVLSLVGNAISAVSFGLATGSQIDTNGRKLIPIAEPVFDEAAIRAANSAILKLQPGVKTTLMLTQDPGLYAAQNALFDAADANKDNREYLKSLLGNRGATHLVLITKWRAEAEIHVLNASVASGRLEGLGFYMNADVSLRNLDTRNSETGLLAPFAYVNVRLIDATTLEVLGESHQKRSHVIGNDDRGATGLNAWHTLTSKQKIDYLDALLKDKAALTKVLTYHVVSGKVMAADVKPGMVKTVQGSDLTVKVNGGKVMIDKSHVVQADVAADNGVIHAVDTVLMPK